MRGRVGEWTEMGGSREASPIRCEPVTAQPGTRPGKSFHGSFMIDSICGDRLIYVYLYLVIFFPKIKVGRAHDLALPRPPPVLSTAGICSFSLHDFDL